MKPVLYLFVLIILPFSSDASSLIDECKDKKDNDIAYSQCLDAKVNQAEELMMTWVNATLFELEELETNTGRGSALNVFKRAQKEFDEFRKSNCRWYFLRYTPQPEAADQVRICLINTALLRATELEQRTLQH